LTKTILIRDSAIGGNKPFVFIAGPCVIEDQKTTLAIAADLKELTASLEIPFIFKASYDKANRTSVKSFRGPGIKEGLEILNKVRSQLDVSIISDVHSVEEVKRAAEVLDIIQIPAFLCRQTDLVLSAAGTGKVVNVKKGQFMAPWDMKAVIEKIESQGNQKILLTERGASFGYNNLVSDFRSLAIMRQWGYPVIFDASHSVQQPGGLGSASGGQKEFIPVLARAAIAVGCDGLFMEVHHEPHKAKSDGPNMLSLRELKELLPRLKQLDSIVKK